MPRYNFKKKIRRFFDRVIDWMWSDYNPCMFFLFVMLFLIGLIILEAFYYYGG